MAVVHRRRAHPVLLFVAFVLVVYAIFSVGIAISTEDRCDSQLGNAKTWQFVPPHWECGT